MTYRCGACQAPVIMARHVRLDITAQFDPEPSPDGTYLLHHSTARGVLFAQPGGSPAGIQARYPGELHRVHICPAPPA